MGNKASFGVVLVLALVFAAEASSFLQSDLHLKRKEGLKANFCPTCVSFSDQTISNLLNIILNAGISGGCNTVCSLLANKTGSQPLGEICTFLCDIVGVEAFAKLIQKADLDSIYFCELLNICAVNDQGDAKITNITMSPMKGPAGTKFTLTVNYDSKNGTGTGELSVDVKTVDALPLGSAFLLQAQPAGSYSSQVKINASPDPNCDPTSQPCEQWLPGNYTVTIALCNGECGSKHPHSSLYDEQKTMFTLTEN